MKSPSQHGTHRVCHLVAVIIGIVALSIFALWLARSIWIYTNTELAAKCDDNYTIWRYNPGAWSSYIYEIRDGGKTIESGLRSRHLNEFTSEHHCLFLGGG